MEKLNLTWVANFSDGSSISQFDSTGHEILFKVVQDKLSLLDSFQLIHQSKNFKVTVNIATGNLYINEEQSSLEEPKVKNNIRLIFFRRHRVLMNEHFVEQGHKLVYFIGFQYLNEKNENCKVIIQVDQEGNILIT